VAERGQPRAIRCDNGAELTSRHFLAWCVERQIELVHIQPGKPTQDARVETFMDGCEKSVWRLAGSRICSTSGGRSQHGERNTTKNDPTAAWDTEQRKNFLIDEGG